MSFGVWQLGTDFLYCQHFCVTSVLSFLVHTAVQKSILFPFLAIMPTFKLWLIFSIIQNLKRNNTEYTRRLSRAWNKKSYSTTWFLLLYKKNRRRRRGRIKSEQEHQHICSNAFQLKFWRWCVPPSSLWLRWHSLVSLSCLFFIHHTLPPLCII